MTNTWKKRLKRIVSITCVLMLCTVILSTAVFAVGPQTTDNYEVIIQAVVRDSEGNWVSTNALISKEFDGTTDAGSSGGSSESQWQWTPSDGGYVLTTTLSSHANAWGGLKYPTALWEYDTDELVFVGIGRNSYATEVAYPDDVNSEYLFERNSYLLANSAGGGYYRTYIFEQKAADPGPVTPPETSDYVIDGFTKERVTQTPVNGTDGFFHASLLPEDVNYDAKIVIPSDGSVKLLYKLTVTGDEDAIFAITDAGATVIDSNCGANGSSGIIYGDIPANDVPAIIYVTKLFTANDIVDGQLINIATIEGEADSVLDDTLDNTDGVNDDKYTTSTGTDTAGSTTDKTSLPGMDKTIVLEDGTEVDKDTVAAGDTVEFQLESNVPENLKEAITYPEPSDPEISTNSLGDAGEYTLVFHDQMAEELTLNPDSFEVMLDGVAIDEQYYDIVIAPDGITDGCTFEVSVDLAAMYEADVITEADFGVTPITVNYTATLNKDATAGAYLNTAWVAYPDGFTEKDTVEVITYGINIFKYDQGDVNKGLPGAEFALYGADSVTVADDGTVTVNEGATALRTVTSENGGHATIGGLDEGTYYLVETKAPDGYLQSDRPLKVVVPNDAGTNTYLVSVNFANTFVPHTGGSGTTMYTIGGAVILIAGGALLLYTHKARKGQKD